MNLIRKFINYINKDDDSTEDDEVYRRIREYSETIEPSIPLFLPDALIQKSRESTGDTINEYI